MNQNIYYIRIMLLPFVWCIMKKKKKNECDESNFRIDIDRCATFFRPFHRQWIYGKNNNLASHFLSVNPPKKTTNDFFSIDSGITYLTLTSI